MAENLTDLNLSDEREMTLKTDGGTCFTIELLFTDLIKRIQESEPELASYYALFGVSEGLIRSAKLMLEAAPNNPELAQALANIGKAVSFAGMRMAEDIQTEDKLLNTEKAKLESQEIEDIMAAISGVEVNIPENLKKD